MKEFFDSVKGMLLVALVIAVVIIDITWLHNPPFDYKYPSGKHWTEQPSEDRGAPKNASNQRAAVQIECDPNCIAKEADSKGDQGRIARLYNKLFDDPMALLTLVLALANVLLVLVGIGQWRLIRLSLGDMKKTAEAAAIQAEIAQAMFTKVQRPYVFVLGVKDLHQSKQGEPYVQFDVANHGRTPAIIVGFGAGRAQDKRMLDL